MSLGVLCGVFLLGGAFLFYMLDQPPDPGFQTVLFAMLLLISGTIFTSTVFSDYGIKRKAIAALTLPASSFEKYLVGWLYSYPIFLILYTCVFYLLLTGLASLKQWPGFHFEIFNLFQQDMIVFIVLYSILHAIAIYGAVYFNKLHFIKTGFAFFIGYGISIILNTLFLKFLTGEDVRPAIPFGYLNFDSNNQYYSISKTGTIPETILIVLMLAAVLIWIAAYYRLKEKQV